MYSCGLLFWFVLVVNLSRRPLCQLASDNVYVVFGFEFFVFCYISPFSGAICCSVMCMFTPYSPKRSSVELRMAARCNAHSPGRIPS